MDWPALRALASGDFRYEDRRRHALVAGDVEVWIKSIEFMAPRLRREARELIGTVGDRIALERVVGTGEPDTGAFEIEFILLTAIDADGQLAAWIRFDLDDRRAAFTEAHARFVAGEAASAGGQAPIVAFNDAFDRRDWEAVRESLADDLVLRDHRTPGWGTLDRDQWIDSMRVLADLVPDVDAKVFRILTWNHHGRVDVVRVFGTMPHGGGRIRHFESFDGGDADQALACFAELCPNSRGASPNASRI
ncbi:MAG: hypothetical protein HY271_10380 [Deltaproteobacteria bacterium]|nr:hypothetical protein [Deltaproteobacteria bacterium]